MSGGGVTGHPIFYELEFCVKLNNETKTESSREQVGVEIKSEHSVKDCFEIILELIGFYLVVNRIF